MIQLDILPAGWLDMAMILAVPWYAAPASLFWLTTILLLIGTPVAVTAILSLRSITIRRRLLCSIISRSQMIFAPKPMRDELQISYQSEYLTNPYVATIEVSNVGRTPVLSSDFTQDRALTFQLDVPIIKVLTVEHKPNSAPRPTVGANGQYLSLQPELLVRNEIIRASLLTEGQPGDVKVELNPFSVIAVQLRDREAWLRQRNTRLSIAALILLPVLAISAIGVSALSVHLANQDVSNARSTANNLYCVNLLESVGSTGTAIAAAYARSLATKETRLKISNYSSLVNIASKQVHLLTTAYRAAARSGVALGRSSRVPTSSKRAIVALEEISRKGATRSTRPELVIVQNASNLLNSPQAIPPGC